jgi:hypothetical protein
MPIVKDNARIVTMCGQRLTALEKFVETKSTMTVNGKERKLAELIAVYQVALDTRTALIAHRAVFDQALVARDDAESVRRATDKELKVWVVNEFGAGSQEAQEFGFPPPKVGARSAEAKAKAVERNLATRKARGTMGKRQRLRAERSGVA